MKVEQKPKIIIIVGPTASGKSGLAIDIAKKYSGEIISADSRQIYKKLDIGTAKVTKDEMYSVPHHLIDIIDIDTAYSAVDFKRDATEAITEINKRGNLPIIAGGTFFYIDALLEKVQMPEIPSNAQLRAELEQKSTEELFALLQKKDPIRAKDIDAKNPRRLVRALEIVDALGAVPKSEEIESPYEVLSIGITLPKEELRERLFARAELFLQNGFTEEVQSLLSEGISRERLTEIGFEYQLGLDLIDGKLDAESFPQTFVEKNWQYAKRQLTWLKRDRTIHWVSLSDKREIDLLIKQFLLLN